MIIKVYTNKVKIIKKETRQGIDLVLRKKLNKSGKQTWIIKWNQKQTQRKPGKHKEGSLGGGQKKSKETEMIINPQEKILTIECKTQVYIQIKEILKQILKGIIINVNKKEKTNRKRKTRLNKKKK